MPLRLFDQVAIACDRTMVDLAGAMRAALESYRLHVRFFRFVQHRKVLDFFGRGVPDCNWTVLVAHGVCEEGIRKIRFEAVDQVDGDWEAPMGWVDTNFDLTPANIPDLATGARGGLLSLACGSGTKEFADAFLAAGYQRYIGPTTESGYYNADAALLFSLAFFYYALAGDRDYAPRIYSDEEAAERAAEIDSEFGFGPGAFRCFTRES
ncbi:MAG TPA: hypothetical protein VGV93_13120 [Acidimicrobiales bacterium]|nr:hypothetical protein [Acidimicrobiales bacterium]